MAKVSSGRAFPKQPHGLAPMTGDPAIIAQGLAGNSAHNTYATEADYDRAGELGSFHRKASGLHAADFDDDCLTDGIDWERD
jgi:hypothetical protein